LPKRGATSRGSPFLLIERVDRYGLDATLKSTSDSR
jgi:hypothetical protein